MHRLARWLLTRPLARHTPPRRPARLGLTPLEDRTVPAWFDFGPSAPGVGAAVTFGNVSTDLPEVHGFE